MTTRSTILLVAKPPRPGQAKTRLATTRGPEAAAAFAAAFLRDVWGQLSRVAARRAARLVLLTPEPDADHGVQANERWAQGDGDLGARLSRGFARAAGPCVAFGADAPGLPDAVIDAALDAIAEGEAALCPADDGGYVLLGLPRWTPGLLDGLPWSSDQTFAATAARFDAAGQPARVITATLPSGTPGPWPDVDTERELRWLLDNVSHESAPETFALARQLGLLSSGT